MRRRAPARPRVGVARLRRSRRSFGVIEWKESSMEREGENMAEKEERA
jgi:hypothetical protein